MTLKLKKNLLLQKSYFLEYIEKVLVSKKISFGKKKCEDFIGYLCDYYKIKPLHIMLTKASVPVKS